MVPLRFSHLLRLAIPGLFFAPLPGKALTVTRDGVSRPGLVSSLAMIDGRPAIAFTDGSQANGFTSSLKYVRALDATGAAWGTPVTVEFTLSQIRSVSLTAAGGNPAIGYSDQQYRWLYFSRAANPAGTSWGPRVQFDTPNAQSPSLAIVDGNPAVSFLSFTNSLHYIAAADAEGTQWKPAVTVASSTNARRPSMAFVNGEPAIAIAAANGVWLHRRGGGAGAAWGTAVNVPGTQNTAPDVTSLKVVNGHPAIVYNDKKNGGLFYVRALDPSGSAWKPPVPLMPGADVFHAVLEVIAEKPAIALYMRNPDAPGTLLIRYLEARDADGDTAAAWSEPKPVNTNSIPSGVAEEPVSLSLLDVGGRAAIAYHDTATLALRYLRSQGTDWDGVGLWPADMIAEQVNDRARIPHGAAHDFGLVPVGQKKSFTVNLTNTGGTPFILHGLEISGPDAAEFSLTTSGTGTSPGGSVAVTVECTPVSQGLKSATLSISSSAENPNNFWSLHLSCDSRPAITVARGNHLITDGETMDYPLTLPGGTADLAFTVSNNGGANLTGLNATIDGPDSAEFSVASALPASLSPGGTATLTLRHVPRSAGVKTAFLHIANNLPAALNPFDITMRLRPGVIDPSFAPLAPREVKSIAVQPDGKILTGGEVVSRYHPDSTPDVTFFEPAISGGPVQCIAVQKDGMILLGGSFTGINGRPVRGLARLHNDGTMDQDFTPVITGDVLCLAVQPDGRILAGGNIPSPSIPSQRIPWLGRFHPDGSPDAPFQPAMSGLSLEVRCLTLQPDGKILIGGRFIFTGNEISGIARLHPDGTLDFSAPVPLYGVHAIALQPDGRILAGAGSGAGDSGDAAVIRFFPGGARDSSIAISTDGDDFDLALQTDGGCIVVGGFSRFGPVLRNGLARIDIAGTIDPHIYYASVTPRCAALQADGKFLIGGFFPLAGNLIRYSNDPASSVLNRQNSSTIRWLRGGSAPEVRDVTFDIKPDNSPDWIRLGSAARIPGGWELSGLTLPSSGHIRAQACAGGSVIEQTASILTPLDSWRLQHFATSSNTGPAADDADPDHDGLTNFTEFAFGLSPVDRGSNALPAFTRTGNTLTATFPAPAGTEDVLYSAEWSFSMQPGSWVAVPNTGIGGMHLFRIPVAGEKVFIRYAITSR